MSRMINDILPWMLQFASAKTWINTIRSERTKTMYLLRLKQYCDAVHKNPDQLIDFKVEGLRNVATAKEFQADTLLNDFLFHGDLVTTAQVIILASVKSFYKTNWRELNSIVGQCVELPEAKKRTPKMQEIIELDEALLLCIKNLAKLDTPQTETKITNKDYKILVANELTNKNEA